MNFLQVLYQTNFELNTMQSSCGMTLIFLLVRLQWNKSNTEIGEVKETSKGNSSITENPHSAGQLTSQRFVLHMTTTVSPSTISHAAPAAANTKENIMKRTETISGAKGIRLRSSDGTTFSSNVSQKWNKLRTSFHRSPMSLATFRTTGDFSEVIKSAAPTPSCTVTPSHSTVIYTTLGASVLPSDNSSTKPTLLWVSVTLTSPMAKQDSPTPYFNPIQQTKKLNHNSSNPSTASPNPKDANEGKDLTKVQPV